LAVVLSWARVKVNVSPVTLVTKTISALPTRAVEACGQIVQINGTFGNSAPSPAEIVRVVPDVAGKGATVTMLQAKFVLLGTI